MGASASIPDRVDLKTAERLAKAAGREIGEAERELFSKLSLEDGTVSREELVANAAVPFGFARKYLETHGAKSC